MLPLIATSRFCCMVLALVSSTSALDEANKTQMIEKQVLYKVPTTISFEDQVKSFQVKQSSLKQVIVEKPKSVLTAESIKPLVEIILSSMMQANNSTKEALVKEISQKIIAGNLSMMPSPSEGLENNYDSRIKRSNNKRSAVQKENLMAPTRHAKSSFADTKRLAIQSKSISQSGTSKLDAKAVVLPLISPPDISQIKYIINNNVCQRNNRFKTPILAVILVTSHIGNQENRNRMRKAFPAPLIEKLGIRRVFVLATLQNGSESDPLYHSITQKEIVTESKANADIVQIDIIESHKNLTHKNLMGLKWASAHCSAASFIVKSDDDVIIDYYQMADDLNNVSVENKNALLGRVWMDNHPSRDSSYVYYVSYEEYPDEFYPTYLSGFIYVLSLESAKKLVLTSKSVPYLKIDDVFLTGMVAKKAGLKHVDVGNKYTYNTTIRCCHDDKTSVIYKCESVAALNYMDDPHILDNIRWHSEYCYESKKCKEFSEVTNFDDLECF